MALLTDDSVNKVQLQRSWIKLVRPLSTVKNTRYTRVFHSRQWSNYNIAREATYRFPSTAVRRGHTVQPPNEWDRRTDGGITALLYASQP